MFGTIDDHIEQIISEHFDITDNETRRTLLSVNEADGNQILVKLASKLYDNIIEKVDDVDFGTIPLSKGDITKIDNYEKLIDCLDTMKKLIDQYNQDSSSIDVILKAVDNLKSRKSEFEKGFRYNVELTMLIYCTITMAVISATSLMISSCIEFIKSPNQDDIKLAISNISSIRTKESLLFHNLERFNSLCSSGKLDKHLDYSLKMASNQLVGVDTGLIVSVAAIATVIRFIIPMLRELIFFFFNTRTKLSDYFDIQANLLQMNAYNLQMNESMKKSDREKIAKKQLKLVKLFNKISNFLSIENKKSEKAVDKQIKNDNKKYQVKELVDSLPDSAASSSALF